MQTLVNPPVKVANGFDESAGVVSKTDSYLCFVLTQQCNGFDLRDDCKLESGDCGCGILPSAWLVTAQGSGRARQGPLMRARAARLLCARTEKRNIPKNLPPNPPH